jgi:hypothetical protein
MARDQRYDLLAMANQERIVADDEVHRRAVELMPASRQAGAITHYSKHTGHYRKLDSRVAGGTCVPGQISGRES